MHGPVNIKFAFLQIPLPSHNPGLRVWASRLINWQCSEDIVSCQLPVYVMFSFILCLTAGQMVIPRLMEQIGYKQSFIVTANQGRG